MPVELTPSGMRGATPPRPPRFLRKPLQSIVSWFMRRRGGRMLQLTTVGARSGKEHTTPLLWFGDQPGSWVVIASYGGARKHPAWYINMARNPDQVWIEVGGRKLHVRAESLHGAEREALYRQAIKTWPGYAGYREKTDREIPVVRLTPA